MASAERPPPKGPKWAPLVASAQVAVRFEQRARRGARVQRSFRLGLGYAAQPRALFEQAQVAASAKGPCKVTGDFAPATVGSHAPRRGAHRLAFTPRGALVAWTDEHESAGHDHAYAVLLDSAMRPSGAARDVTPEGGLVARPSSSRSAIASRSSTPT